MNGHFSRIASTLSDEELRERVENPSKYQPDAIEAALAELKNRRIEFAEDELHTISNNIQVQRYKEDGYIVNDPAAPYFYSRRVICVFTILFGPLFGLIMFAMNIIKTPNKSKAIWILLFGLGYMGVVAILPINRFIYLFFALAAAVILDHFWKRFIGNETFYRARPFWIPLIIGVIFLIFYFGEHFYNDGQ